MNPGVWSEIEISFVVHDFDFGEFALFDNKEKKIKEFLIPFQNKNLNRRIYVIK